MKQIFYQTSLSYASWSQKGNIVPIGYQTLQLCSLLLTVTEILFRFVTIENKRIIYHKLTLTIRKDNYYNSIIIL